jgi:hypothetical protein
MPLPVVAISNFTTCLTDAQVKQVIPALQKQVTDDFRPYWHVDATIALLPKAEPLPAGWWQIVLVDDPDMAGALGYHELNARGGPLGKVFAKFDLECGQSWSNTLSHELLEMLGDPWIDYLVQGLDGQLYALEVADPVEADELGYQLPGLDGTGVLVSDFVTPAWFESTDIAALDFKGHLTKPLQLAPGGYISILVPNQGWTQVQANRLTAAASSMPEGSRRQRRTNRADWRLSKGVV